MKKTTIIILLIILASFALAFYFYPQMPDKMASHWNAQGQVDDYMSKCWGLFLMPLISLGLFILFLLIPIIDPLKKNIEKFRKYFDWFIVLIIAFLFYIYLLTIFWNFGYKFDMGMMMIPAIAVLFYFIGIMLKHARRNWFIGIRTPWTLSNDIVWDKTHQLGSKLFKISAIIALFGMIFSKYAIWIAIIPILASVIYIIIYSYFAYKKDSP